MDPTAHMVCSAAFVLLFRIIVFISADDMGLGKTLTMISLILKQRELRKAGSDDEKAVWLNRDKQLEKCEQKRGSGPGYSKLML